MFKRKSSKTTAQGDPAISDDAAKETVEADNSETSDSIPENDTISLGDESTVHAADVSKDEDTPAAQKGDDTLIAQDAVDMQATPDSDETVMAEDAADTVTTQDIDTDSTPLDEDESIAPQEAKDSSSSPDAEESITSLDADDGIADQDLDETIAAQDEEERFATEPKDETAVLQNDDTGREQDDVTAQTDENAVTSTEPEKPEVQPAALARPAPERKRRTVLPMIIGGFIAAVLGFFAARTDVLDPYLPEAMRAQVPVVAPPPPPFDDSALTSGLAALSTRIGELEATVAALPEPQDPSSSELASDEDISAIESDIAALNDQLEQVSNRVAVEAPVSVEALNTALAEFRKLASDQQAEIEKMRTDQENAIKEAEISANATLARTAMTGIQSALKTGAPFTPALDELEKSGLVEVPQILKDVAVGGVSTLAGVQDTLPDAARAALLATREAETSSGLGGFIKLQLGARAVQPREGSDPDAILSRVEAATREGDLETALAEAETLPPETQDAMRNWIQRTQSRHNAILAAKALAERLSAP